MRRKILAAMMVAAGAAALAAPAVGQRTALAMLGKLEHGNWEMRYRDGSGSVQRICLDSGQRLIQLRHPADKCRQIVVDDNPAEVTVQYTCPGKGYGRTQIRWETSRLVQIDSQGIANGLPFAFAAEARRVGECSGG